MKYPTIVDRLGSCQNGRRDRASGGRNRMSSSHANRHAPESRQGAVQPCESRSPVTYAEVARELGVDAGTLSKWVAQAKPEEVGDPSDNPFQMAEELRRLRRENDRLKRENEMLPKASALFASHRPWATRRRGRSSRSCCPTGIPAASPRCAACCMSPGRATASGRRGGPASMPGGTPSSWGWCARCGRRAGDLRLAQGLHAARARRRLRPREARGARHARARLGRRARAVRQEPGQCGEEGQAGQRRPRPRETPLRRRRARPGVVRRHHLRAHAPGLAVPGGRDGHVAEKDGGAGRWATGQARGWPTTRPGRRSQGGGLPRAVSITATIPQKTHTCSFRHFRW